MAAANNGNYSAAFYVAIALAVVGLLLNSPLHEEERLEKKLLIKYSLLFKVGSGFFAPPFFWYNKTRNSLLGGFIMVQQSRLLRDNPSDFPYDFEKQILSKQSSNTIYHWHPELEIVYVKKRTCYLLYQL